MAWLSPKSDCITIVRNLEGRIKEYDIKGRTLIVKPKKASFDELIFQPRRISLTGEKYKKEFICYWLVAKEEEMDKEKRELYRSLKGLECRLEWKGFPSKTPSFVLLNGPADSRRYPSLCLDKRIANALNSDEGLMGKIRQAKVDDMVIGLFSGTPRGQQPFFGDDSGEWRVDFYRNPTKIQWIFYLMKGMYHIGKEEKCRKTINCIFDVLDESVLVTRRVTESQIKAY